MTLNLRNGLKWRIGPGGPKPRWEPSPANRALGIKGRDLKDLNGNWITDRGLCISLCDARQKWSALIREAMDTSPRGLEARDLLQSALDALRPARDTDAMLKRNNVADLLEKASALLQSRPERSIRAAHGRTVENMVDAYFADPPPRTTTATLHAYRPQGKRIKEKFGTYTITELTPGMIHRWYHELKQTTSPSTSSLCIGAFASIYRWAVNHDWIAQSPVVKIGVESVKGRLVFWPFEMEKAFVTWCDANGFEDIGDAVTLGCWTGARQIDMVKTTLADLSGTVWRYTPQKTAKTARQAVAGLLPAVTERVNKRRLRLASDGLTYLNKEKAFFLFNRASQTAHTSDTISWRFRTARAAAARAAVMGDHPELNGIADLRLQDTRDTCVTRLFLSKVTFENIPPWTGHSRKSAEDILANHYRVLLDEEARDTASILAEYAKSQGVVL